MRRGILGVCVLGALAIAAPAGASPEALVVFLPATDLREALDATLTGTLARAGGVGLLTAPGTRDPVAAARAAVPSGLVVDDPGLLPQRIRDARQEVVVVAIAPLRGPERQDVALVIVARGDLEQVLHAHGPVRGLSSDTTRRPGLVSTVDLSRTLGTGRSGTVMRIEGSPPLALVERYRVLAPLRAPAGAGLLALALVGLVAGVFLLLGGPTRSGGLRAVGLLGLFAVALPVALLPAVALPRPTALSVAVVAVGGAAMLTLGAWLLTSGQPAATVAVVAGAGMGVVIVDGMLGWPGMLMPLIGGSAFEGSRMYGLGNGYGGVLVAGTVLAASRLRPVPGMVLLMAVGLLGGLPSFGANLGVATTLSVAAGAWLALRVLGGPRPASLAAGLGLTAFGVGGILAIHRVAELPTHVTQVLESAERFGVGEIVRVYVRRLAINVEGTVASPAAWLVVVALPVVLIMAWRRADPFRPVLTADPAWRDAVVVLAVASIAGYLVNDTIGVAGMGFVYLAAALVYPSLAMRWT